MNRIDLSNFAEAAGRARRPFHANYYAMYSSVLGGIVTDPALMLIPADDHVAHRGDGVFETFKCVGGSLYNLQAHIARLARSATTLSIRLPAPPDEIARICVETVREGARRDCSVRALVSRGPGSFGVNPYDCPDPQLYVTIYRLSQSFMEGHPSGARAVTTSVPLKDPFFARVKTCNYLPNVMMKKEAVDRGVDFVMAFDERGLLAEAAVENAGIVTADRRLLFPGPERILRGTTAERVVALGAEMVRRGDLAAAAFADVPRTEVLKAAELLIVGTTPDVAAVVELDGRPVGDGRPGPIGRALLALLQDDMLHNASLLTPVWG